VIHSKWTPVPGRFKDYIALPKPNRYQSLHTTVVGPGQQRIEIQIRTHEMHRVAEWGVVAHWDYNTPQAGGGVHPEDAAKYSWLRELAQFQKDLKDPAEFLESVKIDLFPDEVYVFTPRGDVRMFPRGATLIDFAYAIHTEVGDHCSGARVNGQLAPIRDKLRNGDVVEVNTSSDAQPVKDWLEACVTTRARNRIRGFLRAERREKSMNLGRELMGTEMHAAGMSLTKFLKNAEEVARICREFQVESREELFVGIGFGKIEAEDVVRTIRAQPSDDAAESNGERKTPVPEFKEGAIERFVRKVQRKDHGGIRVSGTDEVLIRYAKCCNPVTGDAIIGFITRGRGVTVHRRECPKAFDSDPERRVEVSWSSQAKITRPVSLRVRTENEPGILANVTQTFSAQHINISEANCRASKDGLACNVFTFMADDLTQLKTLMRELDKVRGVVQVERV
jgi:GTP pyrophosphokinase